MDAMFDVAVGGGTLLSGGKSKDTTHTAGDKDEKKSFFSDPIGAIGDAISDMFTSWWNALQDFFLTYIFPFVILGIAAFVIRIKFMK
jgi:hypothetical protein